MAELGSTFDRTSPVLWILEHAKVCNLRILSKIVAPRSGTPIATYMLPEDMVTANHKFSGGAILQHSACHIE